MYHCHIHFYLTGHSCRAFEVIKEMPPLEHFTHKFSESEIPNGALASEADVILADIQGMDAREAVRMLVSEKKQGAELILFVDRDQISHITDELPEVRDIWAGSLTEEEIKFHFARWQQAYKMEKDFWQTTQYFESTINNIPNLIWYKDKDGVHKKVNDSFCKTVNKTREQVEGQRHAYIWDVEYDDPACIESENEVMAKQRTFVSEEVIKTGEGMRTLMQKK